MLAGAHIQQGLQGGGFGQGHIARQHQGDAVIGQHGHSLLHRMAGAQLGFLTHKLQGRRRGAGCGRCGVGGQIPDTEMATCAQ